MSLWPLEGFQLDLNCNRNCDRNRILSVWLQSRKDEFDLDDDPEAAAEAEGDENAAAGGKFAWSNTDREYTYDELLGE